MSTPTEAEGFEANPVVEFPIICLGASAGGLEALSSFLDGLPMGVGAAFVVVVHLSPDFESQMPELLGRHTMMPVTSAEQHAELEPDHVYVIPSNTTMRLEKTYLRLTDREQEANLPALPIDIFMRSLAEVAGDRAGGIILSGTGTDGSRGLQAIKECGGITMVQEPSSAKFDGMPVAALAAVRPDAEGPPADLAERLASLLVGPLPSIPIPQDEQSITVRDLFAALRIDGPDLSFLRAPMVLRRLQRRMQLAGIADVDEYVKRLAEDTIERRNMRSDLLITVTRFFREPEALAALREDVLPQLVVGDRGDLLRIWVAGCATGQEAYTIAILVEEVLKALKVRLDYKVFATDLNQEALRHASRGVFTLNEIADVPLELRHRYFTAREGRVTVLESLRQRVIFASHDVVSDPPFVRMDLVVCRNLMIYLLPRAQEQVLTGFYQALRPEHGVLMLGQAETTGALAASFSSVASRAHLYRRTTSAPERFAGRGIAEPPHPVVDRVSPPQPKSYSPSRFAIETAFEGEDTSAALISRNGELEDVICDPRRAFIMPKGPPTRDLSRSLESTMASGLLRALAELGTNRGPAEVVVPGPDGAVRLVLRPMPDSEQVLLLLRPVLAQEEPHHPLPPDSRAYIDSLGSELQRTKQTLQSTIEELQSANEEQQATNEELVASNEELQSTNEELHSVNQELHLVNAEFQKRNDDLTIATDDLDNLLRHTSVATIYLDDVLQIRRLNGAVQRLLPLRRSDVGRPLSDFVHRLDTDLVDLARSVLERKESRELEVRDRSGAWQLIRASLYESNGHQRGVLLTLVEVTRLKNAEASARAARDQLVTLNTHLREQADQLEDMFSVVSHDLKRPLLTMDGMLELGIESLDDPPAAQQYLEKGRRAAAQMRDTLAELTELTRSTRASLSQETVDLAPWLESVIAPFASRAEREGVRLVWLAEGREACFAAGAARGILTNLLENAFVHGSSGGSPRIDVLVQAGTSLRIVVADNGKGIAAEDHHRVFELFRRLDPDTVGSGVGLVAVRRIAARAGGHVEIDSALGVGARFTVELPLKVEGTNLPLSGPTSYSVLLVEDDAIDAKRTKSVLHEHALTVVGTVSEASQRCNEEPFALILLDLSLPDGHGLELLSRITEGPNRFTPIIVLSGHDDGLGPENLPPQVVGAYNKDGLDDDALRTLVRQRLVSAT